MAVCSKGSNSILGSGTYNSMASTTTTVTTTIYTVITVSIIIITIVTVSFSITIL